MYSENRGLFRKRGHESLGAPGDAHHQDIMLSLVGFVRAGSNTSIMEPWAIDQGI
jgi:hypothetical protein